MGRRLVRRACELGVRVVMLRSVVRMRVGRRLVRRIRFVPSVSVRVGMPVAVGVPMLVRMGMRMHQVPVTVGVGVHVRMNMRVLVFVVVFVLLLDPRGTERIVSMRVVMRQAFPVGHETSSSSAG